MAKDRTQSSSFCSSFIFDFMVNAHLSLFYLERTCIPTDDFGNGQESRKGFYFN